MKIGYVHSTGFPSLAANSVQVVQMCRAFAGLGHDVVLFIPRADRFASDQAAEEAARTMFGDELPFKIHFVARYRWFGRMEVLGTVKGTLEAIRIHALDLLYTRNPWSVLFLQKTGIPFVFEAHEEYAHPGSAVLNRYMMKRIVRIVNSKSCRALVTISHALGKTWAGYGIAQRKIIAAHDGVDLEMFRGNISKHDARETLGLPADRRIVVYTGALRSDRGIDLVLTAAERFRDVHFYFVGGSDDEVEHYRKLAESRSGQNTHFPGRVEHRRIPTWLAASDILLMMWTWKVRTIRGCSPMKMFEYMAARRPIVGPAFPTIKEVLEDGRDAILFEPDDVNAMVEALRTGLSKIDERDMPDAAFSKVARDYTWDARCARILAALNGS